MEVVAYMYDYRCERKSLKNKSKLEAVFCRTKHMLSNLTNEKKAETNNIEGNVLK